MMPCLDIDLIKLCCFFAFYVAHHYHLGQLFILCEYFGDRADILPVRTRIIE